MAGGPARSRLDPTKTCSAPAATKRFRNLERGEGPPGPGSSAAALGDLGAGSRRRCPGRSDEGHGRGRRGADRSPPCGRLRSPMPTRGAFGWRAAYARMTSSVIRTSPSVPKRRQPRLGDRCQSGSQVKKRRAPRRKLHTADEASGRRRTECLRGSSLDPRSRWIGGTAVRRCEIPLPSGCGRAERDDDGAGGDSLIAQPLLTAWGSVRGPGGPVDATGVVR